MSKLNLPTSPLAFSPAVKSFPETAQQLKTIQEKINLIAKHLGTTVADTTTKTASQGGDITNIQQEIAALQAAVAQLETEIGGGVYRAGSALTKYQALYEMGAGVAAPLDVTVAGSAGAFIGLASTAAAAGAQITASASGVTVTNSGWAWTAGPVYAALDGALTQTPFATAGALYLQLVGYAVSPTTVLVLAGAPVQLTGGDAAQFVTLNTAGQAALLGVYQEAPIAVTAATSYTLTNSPVGALLMVFLDGMLQLPANYSVSGSTLTFSGLTMTDYQWLQAVYTYA